jgi:hypothetical protein
MGSLRSMGENPLRKDRVVDYSPHNAPTTTILVRDKQITLVLSHDDKPDKEISIFLSLKERLMTRGQKAADLKELHRYRLKSIFTKREVTALMNEWIVRFQKYPEESWDSIIMFPDGWIVEK